ncbi:MAG: hypothetical protein J6X66_04315 [Lachnospiraceae bacterium]|nr:hypothetical protein [Lachnospiraceae bacterium]
MKRKILTACIALSVFLTACSGTVKTDTRTSGTTQTVNDILEQGLAEQEKKTATIYTPDPTSTPTPIPAPAVEEPVDEKEEEPVVLSTTEGIDIDLTSLSSTLVYSEVYNMMYMPEEYIGKTIKMQGYFSFYRDEVSGAEYYSCIIKDATACCAQGIEFIPGNPEAIPADGEDVTVVGVFDTYMEGDFLYATLRDATIL